MRQTPFHAYYLARQLENLPEADKLLPVFASSDIRVYPFQVAPPILRCALLIKEAPSSATKPVWAKVTRLCWSSASIGRQAKPVS